MATKAKKALAPAVSVRELQHNLKAVLARAEAGHPVEITRRGKPVARLVPVEWKRHPAGLWDDIEDRRRKIFGDRIVEPSGSETVLELRGDH